MSNQNKGISNNLKSKSTTVNTKTTNIASSSNRVSTIPKPDFASNTANYASNSNTTSSRSQFAINNDINLNNALLRSINYKELKEQENETLNQTLSPNTLFEDRFFNCINENLSNDFRSNVNIEWLRPFEILNDANAVNYLGLNETQERIYPIQRQLGDCWFVCACFALFNQQKNYKYGISLLNRLLPESSYKHGMLKANFFIKGVSSTDQREFLQVSVDDRLPVNKITKELIYGSCADKSKFWFPLLEKLYAKFYGSNYENIVAGIPEEAFIDLCGAFTLYLNPQNELDIKLIIEKLILFKNSNQLIACTDTIPLNASNSSAKKSHSFIILDINKSINADYVIKLKNPWANTNVNFKELWILNCAKNANNQNDYSEISLKLQDYRHYFGAITLVMHIPDYNVNTEKNSYTDLNGTFKPEMLFSQNEIISNNLTTKSLFVNYLLEKGEFYQLILNPHALKNNSIELLFNITQYINTINRKIMSKTKLKLYFIELTEMSSGKNDDSINKRQLIADYANRIEITRVGRTLSKLFKIDLNNKKALKFQYLLCLFIDTNESNMDLIHNFESINYLFRCFHKFDNGIEIKKLNSKLLNENIHIELNSCKQCDQIFLNNINNKLKFFKQNDNTFYCSNCYSNMRLGQPLKNFQSIIQDYEFL